VGPGRPWCAPCPAGPQGFRVVALACSSLRMKSRT
jgi:hypothetical protein